MNSGRNDMSPSTFHLPDPRRRNGNPNTIFHGSEDIGNGAYGNNNFIGDQVIDSPAYPHNTAPRKSHSTTGYFACKRLAIFIVVAMICGGIITGTVIVTRANRNTIRCSGITCSVNGACLPSSYQCDGIADCEDAEDETGCMPTTSRFCAGASFLYHCSSGGLYGPCIPVSWVCDGTRDCSDGSDESNCRSAAPSNEQFICEGSGQLINSTKVCDGTEDCPGGSDEDRCIVAVDADDGGVVRIYSVATNSYHKICGYADGWTVGKSDSVCEILGLGPSLSSEEIFDSSDGIASVGAFSMHKMVQKAASTCTNNMVMKIHCSASTAACGTSGRLQRIVGGSAVSIEDYPWQVSLQYFGSAFCGGAIVGEKWVVTAAHCVDGFGTYSRLRVIAGITQLTERIDENMEYEIDSVTIHPLYSSQAFFMDVALVKVQTPFDFTLSSIQRVCLPPPGRKYRNVADVTVTGWGRTSYQGSKPTGLQAVIISLYNTHYCSTSFLYQQGAILSGMLCAGVSGGGKDSCQGDSGGPLVITSNSKSYLVGAASWGNGCAIDGYPGVYSEISYARSWIQRNMS